MKHLIIVILFLLATACFGWERKLSVGGPTLDVDSIFQVISTSKGSKPCPSMTTSQKNAIGTPAEGLCVWDSDINSLFTYNGTSWAKAGGGAGGGINFLTDGSFETDISNVTSNTGTITSESSTVYHAPDGKGLKIALSSQQADVEQCETYTEHANTSVEVSCFIKSSSSAVNLCSSNDVTDPLCTDYDGADVWKKVVSSMIVDGTGKMCWRVTTDSAITDDVFVDECVIKALEPSVATGYQEQQTWKYEAQNTLTSLALNIEFSGSATTATTGDTTLITEVDGGTETRFTSQYDNVKATIGYHGAMSTAGEQCVIKLNGTSVSTGSIAQGATGVSLCTANLNMDVGDYFTVGSFNNLNNAGQVTQLTYHATRKLPETQFLTQNTDWYVDANIGGGNPGLGFSSVSTYTAIDNASLSLVNNTSFNNVAIACAGTEEADIGDTTCTANEHVGITFDGWVGKVRACASFGHLAYTDASGYVNAAFQVVETGNASQTILTEGGERIPSSIDGATTAVGEGVNPVKVCGVFSVNGKTTLRVVYEQTTASNVTVNRINADADASIGQQDIHWSVIPISGTMYAKLNPKVIVSAEGHSATNISSEQTVVYATETVDTHNTYNNTTGVFTVPVGHAGYYKVEARVFLDCRATAADQSLTGKIRANTIAESDQTVRPGNGDIIEQLYTSKVFNLSEGDTIDVRASTNCGTSTTLNSDANKSNLHIIQVD